MEPEIAEIENEDKNLLVKEEAYEIKRFFLIGPASFVQQVNKYLDTFQYSIKQTLPPGTTLRVRNKKGVDKLEFKDVAQGKGVPEYHDDLTPEQLEEIFENGNLPNGNVKSRLAELGILGPFQYLGDVDTLRSEAVANNDYGASIFIDESTFPGGGVDYEIEVEAESLQKAQTVLDTILHQFVIPRRETPRKIERFYKAIGL